MPNHDREFRLLELVLHCASSPDPRKINLDHPVMHVTGPVNTGKSTMVDAISFALGMNVKWKLAARRELTQVELTLRIRGNLLTLRRSTRRSGSVDLLDAEGRLERSVPVVRRSVDEKPTLSDELLAWSGLKEILAPEQARSLGQKGFAFDKVWPYLCRSQGGMDQHVVMSSNTVRRDLFELLLGLSEPVKQVLQARIRESRNHREQRERELIAIKDHFENVDAPLPGEARRLREKTRAQIAGVIAELEPLRARETEMLRAANALRQLVKETHARFVRAAISHREACADVGKLADRIAELNRDAHLSGTGTCPACGQGLDRVVPEGHCHLCLQVAESVQEPPGGPAFRAELEQARGALSRAEGRAASASRTVDATAERAKEAEAELSRHDGAELAPLRAKIAELIRTQAGLEERLLSLGQLQAHYVRWQELEFDIQTARGEIEDLEADLKGVEQQIAQRRSEMDVLDAEFLAAIEGFKPPWFAGQAEVDRKTYLPVVDGQKFADLGGGTLAAVNAAYSLALVSFSRLASGAALPQLLILDSPTKNIGGNDQDQEFTNRILAGVVRVVDASREQKSLGQPTSQVIILDNDKPKVDGMHLVELSREEPLLPGITHEDTGENPDAT
ncbi:hypothetical protein [Nocardiopsis sp. NPDC058789]|uniref:hypothetical protein n=1 Tax=Nocardiopsis sp. NPDC058789 TaxID=3346634 RepID=UPI003671079C